MGALAEFWHECHARQDRAWLTGTVLADYLRWYELERPRGQDITEIGVGLGIATRELAAFNRVTAVDVEPWALGGLPCRGLLVDALADAPPADLAICHLVMQHCTAAEVAHLMTVPLRARGVFAFQYAYAGATKNKHTRRDLEVGRIVWHSPEEMRCLMTAAGLTPVMERIAVHEWRGDLITWGLVKATRE